MKFSYNWIKEMVDGLAVDPTTLMGLITIKTAECEGVKEVGAHFAGVCAARVLSAEDIPNSHNRKAVVDTGRYGIKTVVCGAANCRPGLVTAYIPSGTVLDGVEIAVRKVSGVESDGMLCSGAELCINRDDEFILELDAEPGTPVGGIVPDHVIEVDNKSLTHRPDLWGHHGMAREVSAILGNPLKDPVNLGRIPSGPPGVRIAIEDFTLCPRYSGIVVENVKVQASPLWLQHRLEAIGLNPINNVVDVTNYVMSEIAQPMHAFDADKLMGDTIFIRPARDGEKVVALNYEEYALTPAALVIADASGPIALAGVIGGLHSAIGSATTRIVLESANFHAGCIRRTSARLKVRTDASMRFEKSQDPVNTVRGIARALQLLDIVSPGIRVMGGLADRMREISMLPPITLPMDWLLRKLGRDLEASEVRRILEALEFGVWEAEQGVFSVTVPSWRATKDISHKADLVEEIGRMIGYGTITPKPPLIPSSVPPGNPTRKYHHDVRAMAAAQGFHEVYNYSFVADDLARKFGFEPADHVVVANPIAAEQGLLRRSLVPGVYKNILENAKNFSSFRLFEIGYEIHPRAGDLPEEVAHFTAALYGYDSSGDGLFELKRLAECLLPGAELAPCPAKPHEHPSRAAEVVWLGRLVGRLFELHPTWTEEARAAILDLDLGLTEELNAARSIRYQAIRRFPSTTFDLSVIVPAKELVGTIHQDLERLAGSELVSLEYLRQYQGAPLPDGSKSVSFRLQVGARGHTLSTEEATAIRQRLIDGMRALGRDLRV